MIYYSNHKYCRTELILGIYQVVLMDDPTRSFTSFSQDFGLGYYEEGRCRSWAGRHMGGLNAITAEAINPKVNHAHPKFCLFHQMYEDFIKAVDNDPFLTLGGYIDSCSFLSNPNVPMIKLTEDSASVKLGLNMEELESLSLPVESKERLKNVIETYSSRLLKDPKSRLQDACVATHTSSFWVRSYLKALGLSEKKLKDTALALLTLPTTKDVFVQLNPRQIDNHILGGVRLEMADGATITVTECSVESLHSFLKLYQDEESRKYLLQDV
jgi:hypothetical protein